jgi:hypothetical protein
MTMRRAFGHIQFVSDIGEVCWAILNEQMDDIEASLNGL